MPRDLFSTKSASEPSLTTSPKPVTPKFGSGSTAAGEDGYNEFTIHREDPPAPNGQFPDWRAKANEKNNLHPYVQTLSRSNADSCVALEDSVFPQRERCSMEKVGLPSAKFSSKAQESSVSTPHVLSTSVSECVVLSLCRSVARLPRWTIQYCDFGLRGFHQYSQSST